MTTLDRPTSVHHAPAAQALEVVRIGAIAVVAGLVLGIGDLVWMEHVAYPWAPLANSSAVWAVGAFVLGAALRVDAAKAAVAGVVMMLVAVEAYYGWAAATDLGGYATMWSPTAQMWLVFGVFAGAAFGVAGAWTSTGSWWQRVVGTAVGSGVLLGEALHTILTVDRMPGGLHSDLAHTAYAMAALGVLVLVAAARRPGVLLVAGLAAFPTAVFCSMAFTAVGITY